MVRLKGGDPFIFGRGEELETLCEAGILLRCAWHYRRLRLLRLFGDPVNTSRFRPGRPPGHRPPENRRRAGLGEPGGGEANLVFYMGLNQAPAIREKLIAHGMAEDMPAAIVENGTAVTQKVVSGTLGQLDILAQQMASPALIIVGRVVGLRDKLNWFSNH